MNTENAEHSVATKSGSIERLRVRSVVAAKSTFDDLEKAEEKLSINRSRIKGLIDGNAPFSQKTLERYGQGWRTNVNFREAEKIIDDHVGDVWDQLLEVPALLDITVKGLDHKMRHMGYGSIIAEEFTEMLKDWNGFYYNVILYFRQATEYGKGIVYFPDRDSWKFESVKTGAVFVNSDAKSYVEAFATVGIYTKLDIEDLYKKIDYDGSEENGQKKKEKNIELAGWNIAELKKAIISYFHSSAGKNSEDRHTVGEWEALQTQIRNGTLGFEENSYIELKVKNLFTKERSGKISHYIISSDDSAEDYLYKKNEKYDSYSELMSVLFYDIGDGEYKSVKGLGHRVYSHVDVNNRMLCAILDGGMINMSLIFSASGVDADKAFRVTKIGPFMRLSENITFADQSKLRPDIRSLASMRDLIGNERQGREASSASRAPKSKEQVEAEGRDTVRFQKTRSAYNYIQWSRFLKQILKRTFDSKEGSDGNEEAKKFIKACLDRGVPEEYLSLDKLKVKAFKSIGFGSHQMKLALTDDLFSKQGSFDEIGRFNIRRDYIGVRLGYDQVDKYIPSINRNKIPSNEMSHAVLENNDMSEGVAVLVGVDQDHVVHADIHLQPLIEIAKAVNDNPGRVDAQTTFQYFAVAIPHASGHILELSKDPTRKPQVEKYLEIINELRKVADVLGRIIQQQEKEKQKKNEELQALLQEAQNATNNEEFKLKAMKINGDLQLQAEKDSHVAQMREAKTIHAIGLKERKAESDLRVKLMKEVKGGLGNDDSET